MRIVLQKFHSSWQSIIETQGKELYRGNFKSTPELALAQARTEGISCFEDSERNENAKA